jgi:hypothetical protein
MDDATPRWFVPLFPLYFAGLLCLVSFILSTMGGWRRLADSYPDDVPVDGVRFRWQTALFRSVHYGGCLNVTVDRARLRFAVAFPVRMWHPPISIPWSDVRVALGKYWFREVGTFRFAKEPDVVVRVSRRLVRRIAEASQGKLRIEGAGHRIQASGP